MGPDCMATDSILLKKGKVYSSSSSLVSVTSLYRQSERNFASQCSESPGIASVPR